MVFKRQFEVEGSEATQGSDDLVGMGQVLLGNFDPDFLVGKTMAFSKALLNAEASSLLLVDEPKEHLVFKITTGPKRDVVKRIKVPIGKGIAGWVAEHRQPVVVNDVHQDERFFGEVDTRTGFKTESIICTPLMINGELLGVLQVLNKRIGDFTEEDLKILERLTTFVAISMRNARLFDQLQNFFANAIEIFITAIRRKTGRDPTRVASWATQIARSLRLTDDDYEALYYAALLHDIGFLPLEHVRSELTLEEPEPEFRKHPQIGANLLEPIKLFTVSGVVSAVRYHHEHYDGSGFPEGLTGKEIPLAARIIRVAETYVDMGEGEEAIVELQAGSGKHFDPEITAIMVDLVEGSGGL
ncbi:MAG: HD domain-containing phosphohydrolase [Candidatus Bipolaricaulia bacterium]